jgi:hypothetical protein
MGGGYGATFDGGPPGALGGAFAGAFADVSGSTVICCCA